MAYGIGRAHKLRKQNREQLDNTTDTSSAPSYSYDKLNENTDITSKKILNAETHYSTIFALDTKPSVIIQN